MELLAQRLAASVHVGCDGLIGVCMTLIGCGCLSLMICILLLFKGARLGARPDRRPRERSEKGGLFPDALAASGPSPRLRDGC